MARSYAKAYDDVWGDKRLSNNDVMVYTGLVRHSYGESMTVKNLGVRKLAEYCRVTPNTFNSCVKHLEECGWLEVVRVDKSRSEYHLLAPEIVEDTPSEKQDTPAEKLTEQVSPYRKKFHKTIKPAKQDTSTGEAIKVKEHFKMVKVIADSLEIAEAWKEEIIEWVYTQYPEALSLTPRELWEMGTNKFARSEKRF